MTRTEHRPIGRATPRVTARLAAASLAVALAAVPSTAQVDAAFSASPTAGPAALTVSFTNDTPPGVSLLPTWDFGDGTTAGTWDAAHQYAAPGTYTVSLTVLDWLTGASDTATKPDLVDVAPADLDITITLGPIDDGGDPGSYPPWLNLDATITGGTPTAYLWDFGTGSTFAGKDPPDWPFPSNGVFTVTLTASVGSDDFVATTQVAPWSAFGPSSSGAAFPAPAHLEAADVDGDGDADALVASTGPPSTAAWLANDGTGALGAPRPVASAIHRLRQLRTGDVDGDGRVDVLAALDPVGGDAVVWYRNLGAGAFDVARRVLDAAADITDLETADVDGDGDLDVVVALAPAGAGALAASVLWVPNDGGGAFAPPVSVAAAPQGHAAVEVGDMDGDGAPDVVALDGATGGVRVHLNLDAGRTFAAGPPGVLLAGVGAPGVGLGPPTDLDGDGDLDVPAHADGLVQWFPITDGAPEAPRSVEQLLLATRLLTGDVDGDGDDDLLATSNATPHGVLWWPADGGGSFGPTLLVPSTSWGRPDAALVDVDADGDLDLWTVAPDGLPAPGRVDTHPNILQWTTLGGASRSVAAPPRLAALGELVTGTPLTVDVLGSPARAPLLLWLSLASAPIDVLDGTLHAFPKSAQVLAVADAGGGWSQTMQWSPSIPAGVELWLQAIVVDGSAPAGLTLSNALHARTP